MVIQKTWDFECRSGRKLHIGIDANSDEDLAFDLTDKDIDDASHGGPCKWPMRQLRSWTKLMIEPMSSTPFSPGIRPMASMNRTGSTPT
jgi:hypothetical protein